MRQSLNFTVVGPRPQNLAESPKKHKRRPWGFVLPGILLLFLVLGCMFAEMVMTHDPLYFNLNHISEPPGPEFLFGTDAMGRDVFSMIWYGGRISLTVGVLAAAVSTGIAVLYGCISGLSCEIIDDVMMRFAEIALSIPSILVVVFIQAIIGQSSPAAIAVVIGATGWMNMAKIVRSEVRQIRHSGYVQAAKGMGAGFLYILRRHFAPGFFSSILFMVVTNIGSAIGTESTLSFFGIGLPAETVSWGTMLSQADRALLSNQWWIIVIPGLFLIVTLLCVTELGNELRRKNIRRCSNL